MISLPRTILLPTFLDSLIAMHDTVTILANDMEGWSAGGISLDTFALLIKMTDLLVMTFTLSFDQ